MRPKYIFSSRKTGRAREGKNLKKQRAKFPALLQKVIDISDIILEVIDARFIEETRNKSVEEYILRKGKRIIFVANKVDLAENLNKNALKEIKPYVLVSCKTRQGTKELRDKIKTESKNVRKVSEKFNRIQVGVIGYPNSGKSSLINMLVGKSSAKTGAQAGFTKGLQKIKLTSDILVIDSPGVIPTEKYSTEDKVAIAQDAKVGARTTNKLKDPEIAVLAIFDEYPRVLKKFYEIENKISDSDELLEELGKKLGMLKKGGEIDTDRVARKIIKDWQEGKIRV